MNKILLHITLLLLIGTPLGATEYDSNSVVLAWELTDDFSKIKIDHIDTGLYQFDVINPLEKKGVAYANLGNIGSPYNNTNFNNKEFHNNFFIKNSVFGYFYTPYNTCFYTAKKPFTTLRYTTNGIDDIREETVNVLHTQNVNEALNFGFQYDLISSKGQYLFQPLKKNSGRFFMSYLGNKYTAYTSININKYEFGENGGIIDTLFNNDENPEWAGNTDQVTTILGGGSPPRNTPNVQNIFKNKSVSIIQKYRIGKMAQAIDSSNTAFNIEIGHLFLFETNTHYHTDNLEDNFYNQFYNSFEQTNDSTIYKRISNTLRLELNESKKSNIALRADITNEVLLYRFYSRLSANSADEYFNGLSLNLPNDSMLIMNYLRKQAGGYINNNTFDKTSIHQNYGITAAAYNKMPRKWDWNIQGNYILAGEKQGDVKLNASFLKVLGKDSLASLYLNTSYKLLTPGYLYKYYYSNHFLWEGLSYQKMNEIMLSGRIGFPQFNAYIQANQRNLVNYTYFSEKPQPEQYNGLISISSIEFWKHFIIGVFHFNTKGVLQKSTDKSTIDLPLISLYSSVYFKFPIIFESTGGYLLNVIGVNIKYNSSYYADMYNPALMIYYHQTEAGKAEAGGYPYFDAFLNVKLKSVRFLLKYEHLNYKIRGTNNSRSDYFLVPGYPQHPGSFKAGLSWVFNN